MDQYHYKHKEFLMTETETRFYHVLKELLGDSYELFVQIHVGSITTPYAKKWRWKKALFFGDKFSIDYLVCDKHELRPILAIELDDWSHTLPKRRKRDKFIDRILHEAKLPLLRFRQDESKDIEFVQLRLQQHLGL